MGYLIHEFRLKGLQTGKAINDSGGKAVVMTAGSPSKATLYDPDNDFAALTNPITPTTGLYRFAVADTVLSVDIAVQAPGGQFLFLSGVVAQERSEYAIDLNNKHQIYKLPFSITDTTAATETDTGFDLPTNAMVLPWGLSALVTAIDATEDIEVGILSSESGGDTDGFINNLSVGTLGMFAPKAAMTTGSNETFFATTTLGALVAQLSAGTDVATDVGGQNVFPFICDGTAKSIVYLLSTGSDTGKGYFHLPVQLA